MKYRVTRTDGTTVDVEAKYVQTPGVSCCGIQIGKGTLEFYNDRSFSPYHGWMYSDDVRIFAAGQWSDYEVLGD